MQKKVLYCSILKPASDVRAYLKIGLSISKIRNTKFISIGAKAIGEIPIFSNSELYYLKSTKNNLLNRFLAYFQITKKILQVKPDIIIVNTPDLLIIAFVFKILFGLKICYDVQENFSLNLVFNRAKTSIKYNFISRVVLTLESVFSKAVDLFLVAEPIYFSQLKFLNESKSIFIPNAYLDVSAFTNSQDTTNTKENRKNNLSIVKSCLISNYSIHIWKLYCLNFKSLHLNQLGQVTKPDIGKQQPLIESEGSLYIHFPIQHFRESNYSSHSLSRFYRNQTKFTISLNNLINLLNSLEKSTGIKNDFLDQLSISSLFNSIKDKRNNQGITMIISGTIASKYGVLEAIKEAYLFKLLCEEYKLSCSLLIIGQCLNNDFESQLREVCNAKEYTSWVRLEISSTPVSFTNIHQAIQKADIGLMFYPELPSFTGKIPTKAWDYFSNNLVIFSNANTKEMLKFSNLARNNAKFSNSSDFSNTKLLKLSKVPELNNAKILKFSKPRNEEQPELLNTSWCDYEPILQEKISSMFE